MGLGELQQQLGHYDEARRHLEEAIVEAADHSLMLSQALGCLAHLHHEAGELAAARAKYTEAIQRLHETAHPFRKTLHLAALGALLADCDELGAAETALDEAEGQATSRKETPSLASILIHRGHLDLARMRACEARGDLEGAKRHRAEAAMRLGASSEPSTKDLRFARRLLARALEVSQPAQRALRVSGDARECRMPDGRVVDLSRRPRLRRLVLALVDARTKTRARPRHRRAVRSGLAWRPRAA
jgi:tetratricopeptide (TPR) repeat protein